VKILFQQDPIDVVSVIKMVGSENDGCSVTFTGMPRKNSRGKIVQCLEYEIYDAMAYKEIEKITSHATDTWGLTECVVVHRYGRVNLKEASIVIALSSPHRGEAFDAARYIIDTIKEKVPIWKKEIYTDGSTWINGRI
jgi:molybdopterin synthase catalytic subunit